MGRQCTSSPPRRAYARALQESRCPRTRVARVCGRQYGGLAAQGSIRLGPKVEKIGHLGEHDALGFRQGRGGARLPEARCAGQVLVHTHRKVEIRAACARPGRPRLSTEAGRASEPPGRARRGGSRGDSRSSEAGISQSESGRARPRCRPCGGARRSACDGCRR